MTARYVAYLFWEERRKTRKAIMPAVVGESTSSIVPANLQFLFAKFLLMSTASKFKFHDLTMQGITCRHWTLLPSVPHSLVG